MVSKQNWTLSGFFGIFVSISLEVYFSVTFIVRKKKHACKEIWKLYVCWVLSCTVELFLGFQKCFSKSQLHDVRWIRRLKLPKNHSFCSSIDQRVKGLCVCVCVRHRDTHKPHSCSSVILSSNTLFFFPVMLIKGQ